LNTVNQAHRCCLTLPKGVTFEYSLLEGLWAWRLPPLLAYSRRQAYGFRNFENYRLRVKVLWALDQLRGQTLIPELVKQSWEK
jgi:hypothetical protein